jgi:hypothetical protein
MPPLLARHGIMVRHVILVAFRRMPTDLVCLGFHCMIKWELDDVLDFGMLACRNEDLEFFVSRDQ